MFNLELEFKGRTQLCSYDMTARYDMYCDDGSDGYGEYSCEEINSEELEFHIVDA